MQEVFVFALEIVKKKLSGFFTFLSPQFLAKWSGGDDVDSR